MNLTFEVLCGLGHSYSSCTTKSSSEK